MICACGCGGTLTDKEEVIDPRTGKLNDMKRSCLAAAMEDWEMNEEQIDLALSFLPKDYGYIPEWESEVEQIPLDMENEVW